MLLVTQVIRIGNGNTRDEFKGKKDNEEGEEGEVDEDLINEIEEIIEEESQDTYKFQPKDILDGKAFMYMKGQIRLIINPPIFLFQ